jgi:hypothetical protein
VEEMLQKFDFEKESRWIYDPQGIIFSKKPTYKHHSYHVIDTISNLDS